MDLQMIFKFCNIADFRVKLWKSAPTWILNFKGNWLLLGYRIPKEIGSGMDTDEIGSYLDTDFQRKSRNSNMNADIPDKDTENRLQFGYQNPAGKLAPNWIPESCRELALIWIPILQEIGSSMDAKIFSVRFWDEFNMAFQRFKTPSKYNRSLRYGMVDGFHFGLIDRVSINELEVSPLDFIRSGFLWIFIRLGEDDGWMMDGGW
ncbi:hypothetical protein RhiirC2_796176 [Rhizophagus irregularis]|uniref:Uncharacterized protein n=1 Tax=Rhizophagus irregularis TaxID=588596 RepID=A0A2N1MA49_9GLOM|nr:hypothetical protein RhiirC2_796176 [Rhizophagus irregularis]